MDRDSYFATMMATLNEERALIHEQRGLLRAWWEGRGDGVGVAEPSVVGTSVEAPAPTPTLTSGGGKAKALKRIQEKLLSIPMDEPYSWIPEEVREDPDHEELWTLFDGEDRPKLSDDFVLEMIFLLDWWEPDEELDKTEEIIRRFSISIEDYNRFFNRSALYAVGKPEHKAPVYSWVENLPKTPEFIEAIKDVINHSLAKMSMAVAKGCTYYEASYWMRRDLARALEENDPRLLGVDDQETLEFCEAALQRTDKNRADILAAMRMEVGEN